MTNVEHDDATTTVGLDWPAVATTLYEMFAALTQRGFSDEQAIQLVSDALRAALAAS